jgi:N6-L-threonylcarbamoyladenine synthase
MKILAIETSCDETAIAIIEASGDEQKTEFKILGNALLSQIDIHKEYGGVVPNLAKREHTKNLPPILEQVMHESGCKPSDIDAIAVTAGPGLEPALWVGVEFAKNLAREWQKPLVAVNHMEGHVLAGLARGNSDEGGAERLEISNVNVPLLALLISGGHTEIVLMKEWLKYDLIGRTRDDAVGEAFDKVARMLGLPYPGGPEISKLAEEVRKWDTPYSTSDVGYGVSHIKLPRPMIHEKSCDFSFAGLKTAVLYLIRDIEKERAITDDDRKLIAREFEDAAADVLVAKTTRALKETDSGTLVIGGGVSANTHIRREFEKAIAEQHPNVSIHFPTRALSTDNALMIALSGYYRAARSEFSDLDALKANGNLSLA